MKNVNKKILVPIITAVAMLVKYTIGYEIPDVAVDLAADLIMGAITLVGIFMNPRNTETPETTDTGGQPNVNSQYQGSSDSAV